MLTLHVTYIYIFQSTVEFIQLLGKKEVGMCSNL